MSHAFSAPSENTALTRLADALPLFSRIVDQCPASIVITDPHGTIQYVNPKFEVISGYTAAEVIGQNPRVLKSGRQDATYYQTLWSTLHAGGEWRGEFANKRKDGTLYWESATISALRDETGAITHFLAVKEDITARKAAEEQLVQARFEAEAANRAKSQFLATMSHELRSPLNVITGLSETLCNANHDSKNARSLQLIRDSSHHLLGIIEEILEYSGIQQAGTLSLAQTPFSLRTALDSVQAIASETARRKQLAFTTEVCGVFPDNLLGDARRLRQLLLNLLLNAIKFTAKGRVHLRITGQTRADGHVNLSACVFDSGIGISPEALRTLFNPFVQADATIQVRFGGTGLGLSIARSFAQAMQGNIRVRSRLGQGSVFRASMVLAASAQDVHAVTPVVPQIATLPALTILAADDVHTNREVLQIMLGALGYSVDLVEDGASAVQAACTRAYDLVFLDIQMPIMDGFEAARHIRQNGKNPPRLVALTADLTRGQRDICTAAGLDDVLTKPVTPRDLVALIQRLFATSEPHQAATDHAVLPLIDEQHLAAFTEGLSLEDQHQTLANLWDIAGADLAEHLPRLERALADNQAAALATAAHALKGTLATAGWARAAALAQDLLTLARTDQLTPAPAALESLQRCLTDTRDLARLRLPHIER
jgi:two-component system, sensor histidine kinase and response regulator